MHPWLEEDIAAHLDLANAWLTRSDGTSNADWAGIYESTGSCLRIFVDDRRQHHRLRIAQGTSLTLSDGAVAISAVLSPGCLRTPLEPGHILVVPKYSILYTPYGPSRERLSLTLHLVHLHEKHDKRSQVPPGHVKAIHQSDKVVTVSRSLRQTLANLDRIRFGLEEIGSEETGIIRAQQYQVNIMAEEASPSTQAAYGTQMAVQTQGHNETTQRARETSRDCSASAQQNALLGLLGLNTPSVSREQLGASEPSRAGGESRPSEPRAVVRSKPEADSPAQTDSACHNNLPGKTTVALSAGGFKKSSISGQNAGPAAPLESRFQPTHMPPLYQEINNAKTTSNHITANGSVVVHTRQGKEPLKERVDPAHLANSVVLDDPIPVWLTDTCRADGCGRVPTAQKKLLSSWQKRRMGTNDRFPDANIPIDVLKALKSFGIGTALSDGNLSDGEASTASEDIASDGNDDALSDSDDDTALSWSASPVERSPRRPFLSGPSLPPDSSLQSKNTASQSGSHEASSGQEVACIVAAVSSKEQNTIDPVPSPPQVSDDDDFDMEMELDVPRGLDGEDPFHGPPNSSIRQTKGIVQVKETPLSKNKDAVSLSEINFSTQAQQQPSSGTSKNTSSTSIVFSTYNENSFYKEDMPVASALSSKPLPLPVLPDDYQRLPTSEGERRSYSINEVPAAHTENDDVSMEDPGEGLQNLSSPINEYFQHEQQDTRFYPSSPQFPDYKTEAVEGAFDLCEGDMRRSPPSPLRLLARDSPVPKISQQDDGEQYSRAIRFGSFESPEQSPTSVQFAQPNASFTDSGKNAKRKMGVSPSTNSRRPPKRRHIKLVNCRSNSPTRDCDAELRREKEEHLRKFTERQRAQSIQSVPTDDRSASGIESDQTLNKHEDGPQTKSAPTSAQSDSARDAHLSQLSQHNHRRRLHFPTSGEKRPGQDSAPVNHSKISDQGDLARRTIVIDAHEDDNMSDIADGNELDTKTVGFDTELLCNNVEDANVERKISRAAVKVDYGSRRNPSVELAIAGPIANNPEKNDSSQAEDAHPSISSTARLRDPRASMRLSQSTTVFDTFKRTYPSYPGNERQFLGQCKTIDKLDQQDKMVPKWQWDDFIIRNRTDYTKYAEQCLNDGEDPEPYYQFYKDKFQDTLYTECIVQSRKTLLTAIEELESRAVGKTTSATSSTFESVAIKEVSVDGGAKSPQHGVTSPQESRIRNTTRKEPLASHAKTERARSSLGVQKKTRHSLPSAFNTQIERVSHAAPTVGDGPRQSLPGHVNRGAYNSTASSAKNRSTPAKERGRQPMPRDDPSRASPTHRTSSGRQVPMEPTGDPYRDFIFAHSRITSLTGSARIDSDPRKKWPETLQVRPKAEMKRKGYDVLRWKDDL